MEYGYYMPIHLALVMQRRGSYEAALFWFRLVFDFAGRGLRVEALLPDQDGAPAFARQQDWYEDALNPHAIAATRAGVDQRFILLALVKCLIEYAEAQFAADTAESLALARELYHTAARLLDAEPLARRLPGCDDLVGRLVSKIGDDRWRTIVLEIARDLLGVRLDDLTTGIDFDRVASELEAIVDDRRLTQRQKRSQVRERLRGHLVLPRPVPSRPASNRRPRRGVRPRRGCWAIPASST